MKSFDDYKIEINLLEFVLSHGYQLHERKLENLQPKGKTIKVQKEGETLLIFRNQNNHQLFFNVHNEKDKGSIIDFCYSRLSLNSKTIHSYLAHYKPELNIPPTTYEKTHKQFSIIPEYNHQYLEGERKLARTYYMDPIFQGLIGQYKNKNYLNTAFLLRNKDLQPVGVEMKAAGFTATASGSSKTDSLWLSHNLNNNQVLAITETPIEALSHYQLRGKERFHRSITYAASCGYLTNNQIEFLHSIFQTHEEILLINNNDIAGFSFNLKLILALSKGPMHHHRLIQEGKTKPFTVSISLASLDNLINIQLRSYLNEHNIPFTYDSESLHYQIPRNIDHMRLHQTLLIKALNKSFIHVEIPVLNDFNDDIKSLTTTYMKASPKKHYPS